MRDPGSLARSPVSDSRDKPMASALPSRTNSTASSTPLTGTTVADFSEAAAARAVAVLETPAMRMPGRSTSASVCADAFGATR
jgi:hypothetical protein